MSPNKTMPYISDEMIQAFARTLLPGIREYFCSDEGQQEYAQWKAKNEKFDSKKSTSL